MSLLVDPPQPRTIGVLIATGEPLFGDAAERVIRQYARFRSVGLVVGADEALDRLLALRPDVAIIGPSLPDLNGRQLLRLVRRQHLATRLVFVDDRFDDGTTYELISEGAAGLVAKTASPDELRRAVLAAAAGREFLSDETVAAVTREIRLRSHDERPRLSDREHEILERMSRGESSVAMARAMHLGHSTVKTHCRHLYEKLGVSDRGAAVAEGMRRGLIY